MKRKSLLIMLLVALFVPLAMNAQNRTLNNSSLGSTKLEMKVSPKVTPSNTQLSIPQSLREAALEELSTIATRAVGDYELVTSEQIDWSGDYVITAMSSSTSAYVMTGKASGGNANYGAYTTVTVSNNAIASSAVNSYKVTITEVTVNNTTYYTLKQGSNYLALTQAGNYLYFVTTDPATQTGNNRLRGLWTISYEDDDYVKITNAYTTSRYIRFNNQTNSRRFACYQSTTTNCLEVSLFKYNDGSCVPPTNFAATDVDMESATLSWTENGSSQYWVVYYMAEDDENTSYEIATSTTFTLTGLTPATTYYAMVVPYCGGLDQESDVITFTTEDYPCPAPTDLYADNITTNSATLHWTSEAGSYTVYYRPKPEENIIFEDSFEEGLDNWTTIRNGAGTTNTDWRQYYPSMFQNGGPECQDGDYAAMSRSWASSAYSVDNWLITPQITLDGTLSFWALDDGEYHEHFDVYVSTTGNSVRDFSLLYAPGDASDTWGEITVDLSSYNGQLGYIAIRHQDNDQDYLIIDNFRIYVAGAASAWSPATPSGNTADLTGLDPETTYEWQVMADCGEDGESLWASSTFTTLSACAAPTGLSAEALTNSATLSWTGYADAYNMQYREVDPTAPATLILNVPSDIWGDGTGYQLVLDADHNTYGTTIPETANFTAGTFADFEYTIPENAVCDASTNTIIVNGSATITIPAGVYDYVFLNPDPSSGTYYIASGSGFPSRGDDYEFVAGMTYEFTLSIVGQNDYITLTETADWTPVSGTVTSPYTLTGLDPETTYAWQVKGDGCDNWSESNIFTTLNGILVENIEADDVEVVVGGTATITNLVVLPADATNPAVTYTSNDETIATVENGVVTGVAVGTTTITIAATDGSNVSTDINVTVNGIDVTEITADNVTVATSETATISYTVAPANASDQNVTFTSANTAIATVDADGVVTGVSAGETTITIASVSNPEVTTEITVTVTSNPNAVQFTVNAPANAAPGDVITVEAVLTAPTNGTYEGFTDLLMRIFYDNTAFEYVANSMVYGPVATQAQQYGSQLTPNTTYIANAIQLGINCYDEGVFVTADGVVFSAQFTVLEGTVGSFTFTAQPKDELNFDHEGVSIPYEVTPSTVNITTAETYTKHITGWGDPEDQESNGYNYYLIASPLATNVAPTAVTNMIATPAANYDLYYFDQTGGGENGDGNEWINYKANGGFNLVNGKGYLYANKNTVDLVFTGAAPTDEEIKVELEKEDCSNASGHFEGWNLVGNPFGVTAYITKPFYTMNRTGSEIIAGSGNSVEPMEGIFVIAETDGEEMTFSKTNSGSNSKVVLNVSDNQGLADRAIVRFGEGSQLPKFQLFGNSTKVYFPEDDQDYAVVRSANENELPVNFKASSNGSYTMSVNVEELDMDYLHLIDNMTGMDVDLLQTPSYTFEATTSDEESRFRLVFATVDGVNENSFGFVNAGGNLCIYGVEGKATVQVIDVLGHVLSSETFSGSYEKHLDMVPGVYMIRLIQGNDVKVQKVVVR